MVTLAELRKNLVTTPKDLEKILTPELKNLMATSPNAGFSVVSDYAFECVCCASIGMNPYYRILKETRGPNARKTDVTQIRSARGIQRLSELGFIPEYDSHINPTKDGLVCDHCKDSCYIK